MKLKAGVEIVTDENGSFLLDTRKGVYWHLNPTGVRFIMDLTDGRGLDDVVSEVSEEFQIDPAIVRSDCNNLMRELRRARLVGRKS